MDDLDLLSELPEDIQSYILTMLSSSVKDLLKTSVLSKRWFQLWSLNRDLRFNIYHMLGRTLMRRREDLNININEFVKRVDQFLNSFQGTKIDSFSVKFYLNGKHSKTIDQWISLAIARRVETINLFLLSMPPDCTAPHNKLLYKFPFDLFSETNASTLKHLHLQNCLVPDPTNCGYIPFKNLRSFSLSNTKVDEILIESLLSNCRRLEELHLFLCEFRSSMPKIVSSSLCNLEVLGCYVVSGNKKRKKKKEINLISLDCLQLTSLEYHGDNLDTLSTNTPLLKSIYCTLYNCEDPNQYALFATLPKLEIMTLQLYSRVPTLKITQPFKHLKQLDVIFILPLDTEEYSEFDLLGILTLLQVSPLLHKLSIMLTNPRIVENQKIFKNLDFKNVDICSHEEVKVIEVGGCVGNWYEIEFVMNVLRYAHKLEQIVLRPYWRNDDLSDWNYDPMWFENGRQRVFEKLQSENVVGLEKLVL